MTTYYSYDATVPMFDAAGRPQTYRSGQQLAARMVLRLASRYNPPITDDLLLQVGVTLDRQSALLQRDDVAALRAALAATRSWRSPDEPQGTYVELGWGPREDSMWMGRIAIDRAVLAVVGYGHPWKTRAIPLDAATVDALGDALTSWLETPLRKEHR